jgi:hypothetical protein
MLHNSLQWRGLVSPRELAEQHRGVIPRRVMARLCCVRALNARIRVRVQALLRGSPRARRRPLEGAWGPSSEAEPARGGVSPRARRNPLEGAFDWAASVGRGGHRSVGRALCVCLGERYVLLYFLQVLSRIPLVF